MQTVQRNHHSMLQNLGLSPSTSEEWQKVTTAGWSCYGKSMNVTCVLTYSIEIEDDSLRMLLDVRVLWGRRRAGEDLPAPSLQSTGQNTPTPSTIGCSQGIPDSLACTTNNTPTFTSPFLHVYKTSRGWQQVTEKRQKIKGWMPDPVPFVYRTPKRRPSVAPR
jgi:hypothetical protein